MGGTMSRSRDRKIKFSVFMQADCNYHVAGWRLPDSYDNAGVTLKRWVEFAQIIERAKMDMLFIADTIGLPGAERTDLIGYNTRGDKFEPFTLLSALTTVTSHVGLVATAATTYNEPYNVARVLASLDHLSGGRAGWNMVTGGNHEDAFNFSHAAHPPHADRYARAEEFGDVVLGLWDSFEDDAFPRDKATGRYLDAGKMHILNHKGERFQVRGPLSVARPIQGHPVIVQAGSSVPAKELSARFADASFTAQPSLEDAKSFYADLKGRLAKFGRSPDSLKVMPGVVMYIGHTEQEAREKFERLQELIPLPVAIDRLSRMLGGVDLSRFDVDAPMPDLVGNEARMSTPMNYARMAKRDNLTLRQVAMRSAAGKDHWTLIGSPAQIVDQLEEWFVNEGADGFNLLPPNVPTTLNDFANLIVPEMQRRGLYRTEYEGKTLRENLGVPRPQPVWQRDAQQRAG
jgi:FMN-dependent oxidoreductase (nitrilotriacetate monooxygenase family)